MLVHITTFGCQMNEYDSERLLVLLAQHGYEEARTREDADLILLNTCSVRERAAHKVYSHLGSLRSLKKNNPCLIIGVTGCLAQQEGRRLLEKSPLVDLVLGPGALSRLPEMVEEAQRGHRRVHTPPSAELIPPLVGSRRNPGHKARITVMTGCDNFCAYCVVPYLRGREKSRPLDHVVQEAASLAERGVREVQLLGQNVNSYQDSESGAGFDRLLAKVAAIPALWRLRFTTSHPKDLSPALIEAMASLGKVMEGLHLPIQAGSARVLMAMGRGYTPEEYLAKVENLRRAMPGLALGGDVIVGFPGESERDFQETLSVLDEVRYDFLYSFKYSDRPLTRARKLEPKVPEEVKAERLHRLQARHREISLDINRSLSGAVEEVLVEGPSKKGAGLMTGRSRAGRPVNFPGGPDLAGNLVRVRVTQGRINSLVGELL